MTNQNWKDKLAEIKQKMGGDKKQVEKKTRKPVRKKTVKSKSRKKTIKKRR